ncbi:Elongation factor 2 [Balamuthia mandrillaris]
MADSDSVRLVSIVGDVRRQHGRSPTLLLHQLLLSSAQPCKAERDEEEEAEERHEGGTKGEEANENDEPQQNNFFLHPASSSFAMRSLRFQYGRQQRSFQATFLEATSSLLDCSAADLFSALRLTDGALLLVDCSSPFCSSSLSVVSRQTRHILRQMVREGVQPVLFLDRLDTSILALRLSPEELYARFSAIIQQLNELILKETEEQRSGKEGILRLDPVRGNVVFGSAKHGWAFSLPTFYRKYLSRRWQQQKEEKEDKKQKETGNEQQAEEDVLPFLWGDVSFNPRTRKATFWKRDEKENNVRSFCRFVLAPIYSMLKASMRNEMEVIAQNFAKLGIDFQFCEEDEEENEERGREKKLMQAAMSTFLPLREVLLEAIVHHLPSPIKAQSHRIDRLLYHHPSSTSYSRHEEENEEEAKEENVFVKSMRSCDSSGPLVVYVAKLVEAFREEKGGDESFNLLLPSLCCVGRVLSGTLQRGQKVKIVSSDVMAPQFHLQQDIFANRNLTKKKMGDAIVEKEVASMYLLASSTKLQAAKVVQSGSLVWVFGVDGPLSSNGGMLFHHNEDDCSSLPSFLLRPMRCPSSSSAVVRVALQLDTASVARMPTLYKVLTGLAKTDALIVFPCHDGWEEGELVIAGVSERHLLRFLHRRGSGSFNLLRSEFVARLRETVSANSPTPCMAKSPNKHNRYWLTAQPILHSLPPSSSFFKEAMTKMHQKLKNEYYEEEEAEEEADADEEDELAYLLLSLSPEEELNQTDGSREVYLRFLHSRTNLLIHRFHWHHQQPSFKRIWSIAPSCNVFVDSTNQVQYLNEVKGGCLLAFHWATRQGILCEEPMHGIRFDIADVTLQFDAIHRGNGQIIPAVRKALVAAQLSAAPRLLEPVYWVEIRVRSEEVKERVRRVLIARGAKKVVTEEGDGARSIGTEYAIQASLPVRKSFGLEEELSTTDEAANGEARRMATIQFFFNGWRMIEGDPLDEGSEAYEEMMKTRRRKGLKLVAPQLKDYIDIL